ncbi:MAG: hypothetical protein AB8B69_01890 [Chitinophagales bacterium]
MKYILIICLGILMSLSTFAQQNFYKYRLGITGGTMLYYGDLTDDYPRVKQYTEWAKGLTLDKSLSRASSMRLAFSKGKIRYNDRTRNWSGDFVDNNPNFDRGLNFETDLWDAAFSFVFHADNNAMLDDRAFFSPYFTVGIGVTHFDVFGDLLDTNGAVYNFEDNPLLMQDDDFETDLRKLDTERSGYDDISLHIPIGLGFKFRLSDRLNLNLETNIKYMFTDYLDDVDARGKDNGWNDIYAYTHASLNYNFGYKEKGYRPPVIVVAPQVYSTDATQINELLAMEILTDTIPQTVDVKLSKREQRLADKQAQREQKMAAKEAKKRCKQACKDLPKTEQAACKTGCATEEGYAAYLNVVKIENSQAEAYVDSLESTYTTTDQYQENIDSLQQIIEVEEKERVEEGTSTIETPDAVTQTTGNTSMKEKEEDVVRETTTTTTTTISEEKIETQETPMENAAMLQGVLQMQEQIIALQQQLSQLSQRPSANTSYDPVVEMYKMEADRLRQESTEAKLIGEIQLLRKEIEALKGNTPPVASNNKNNHSTVLPNTSNVVVPYSNLKTEPTTPTAKTNSTTEEGRQDMEEIKVLQKQLEELRTQNADLLKKMTKQNKELIKEQRKAARASNKRQKATEELNETIKEIRIEERDEKLKDEQEKEEEEMKKDN